jgi:intein/homing endonuclease
MSLNGITNITEALQRVNRYEEFASAFDSPNMVQFTGSLKKALTEKGSIKEALNTITFGDNITMFEKYESMLDHNFLIRAHRAGNPEVPASDVFFETARRLIPKSKMGDFSTYSKVISSHNKILSIRNIKGPDNTITEDYIQGLQSLGEDLDITDSTLGKRMSHLLMGKFGEFSDSVGFKRYKYVPHNTDAMFFFTDRGKMMPGLSKGIDVRGVETDYLKDSVTTGGATMMMALNTFNRAMGWLHLGMDEYRTPRDMLTSFIIKRVLPVGGLIAGMDALDNFVDNSGLFEGTPLGEGLYQVPMNVYAGVRLASAGVLDAAGVTSIAKYTEDLLPGSVNSPLSGAIRGIAPFMAGAGLGYHMGGMKGGMTGGLIGGAVGIMLGGGPLGLFDCLPGSELVKTAEGFKPIEVIQEGDMVFTGNGRLRRVTKKWEREPKELIQLDICGVPLQPRASDNHAILTKNQEEVRVWKTLGSVKEGDFLAFPASRSRVRGNIDLLWYLDTLRHPVIVEGESSKRKVYALMEVGSKSTRGFGVQVTSTGIYKQPVDLQWNSYLWPNAKLGRFIGWYLAEGSPMRNPHPTGMGLAINVPKESDYVINTVIEEVRPYLPLGEVSISYDNKQIQISGSHAADIIHNLCHSPYSKEKAIHPDLMEIQSDAFYAGLLGGYIDGDGHIRKNSNGNITNVGIDTTSIDLAWDIWRILLQFGIISSVRRHPNYLNGERKKDKIKILISSRKYVKKLYELCKDHSYKIGSCLEPIELSKEKASNTDNYFYLEDNYAFFRIRNISRIPSNELRYDLEVDEDSSFLGFGITYHNSWDISKSRAEIVQEFKGEKETAIKKGRFWELSSGNFWGNQLSYFRPHLYHLMRSDYKDSPNYKTSMFDEIASYIDPSVYSRKHYFSRPSLEHPGLLSNIPIIGPAINLGNTEAHREDVDLTQLARDREEIRAVYAGGSGSPGEALAMASGTGPSEYLTNNFYPDPRSNSSINSRLSDTFYNFKEVAGLRGFLAETFQESLTGNKQLFADQPTIEANSIGSMGRQFWDLNLGGIAGLSEGIRRIFPRKTADIEYFNPVRNLMPNWMPGSEFYVDYHHGDPFCVSENTPILQRSGYTKAINVEVGSLIYTHKGNWRPIKRKIRRPLRKGEKSYSVTLSGVKDIPLEFSEEHPLFIKRLYKCSFASSALCRPSVRNLNSFCDGKEVCFSKKWLNNEPKFLEVSKCMVGDYVIYPIPSDGNLTQIKVHFKERLAPRSPETNESEIIHITPDFTWVLGLYLAEGSTSKSVKGKPHRLIFSMSIEELEVLKKINIILLEKFGKEGYIKTSKNQAELIICSTKVAQIFDYICPGNLYCKSIPEFIYNTSSECKLSYLLGAFLGDGSLQRTELRYECANEKIVLDLRRLSFTLGIPASYGYRDRTNITTNIRVRSFITTIHMFNLINYDITWLMHKQGKVVRKFSRLPNIDNFSDGIYIYQKITSINEISIDYVYGFEVDDDDSFCCFDFATHNTKIEMGEARLPGESYETIRSIAPVTPGEADLLGTTAEEAMGYYSGDIETIIPRYKWNDKIEQRKKLLIDSLKAQGSLIREQGIVYDTSKNITAYADATYRNDDGEIVPVKFAPYLGKEGGFLAGSASSLNAYLTLSGTRKGLLIGIDETGNTTQAIIFRDPERYEREAESDLQIRMRSYQELAKRRARGEPTAPGIHYSHMDRLKILSDVAYYSNQYKNELKIVKTQIKSGVLGEQEALEVEEIENKVEKLKQKFLFIEDRFGGGEALTPEAQRRRDEVDSRYNAVERTIGKLWQDVTTMRNPLISKLIGNRTALQAYQEDVVYGRAFKEWSSPIESYVKPFYQQMAVSSNPAQGALSGATAGFLMGGPLGAAVGGFGGTLWSLTGAQMIDKGSYIPGDVKKQREIMAAADIAERDRYQMLYEQTGYNEYLYRMRNTIAGAIEINQPMTSGRMIAVSNKPERMYMKGILDDLNTENLQEARALLPQNIAALLDRNVGIRGDVRPEDYTGGYFVEPGDVANTQVPIEDVVVKTMQLEGLNAKDVGLGWQRTLRRMNTMKEIGIEAPAMYQRNLPKRKIEYTIAPAQIKKVLDGILREYNPSITVHSGDGPLEVVVEIV